MTERANNLLRVFGLVGCLWIGCLLILAPLFFTFSRSPLAMEPRNVELYLDGMELALNDNDVMRAGYYESMLKGLDVTDDERAQKLGEELEVARLELLQMKRDAEMWAVLDGQNVNYRDAKYLRAKALWGLLEEQEAIRLLDEALELDPNCNYCREALENTKDPS